jgi:hypothetical protein
MAKKRLPELVDMDAEGRPMPTNGMAPLRKAAWTDAGLLDDSPAKDMAIAPEPTEAELDAKKAAAQKRRIDACQAELTQLLARHNCGLDTVQLIRSGKPGPVEILVVALPEK